MNTKKYLTRSHENKTLAGICGGIGEYLDIDPTVIRVLYVILIFFSGGIFILIYLILLFIIPVKRISHK